MSKYDDLARVLAIVAILIVSTPALAQSQRKRPGGDADGVSPVRGIERGDRDERSRSPRPDEWRTIDGSENNRRDPEMGAAETPLLRIFDPDYADGVSALAGEDRPSAREISNRVADQPDGLRANELEASDFLWQWGQFLDHDIDLTDGVDPPEPARHRGAHRRCRTSIRRVRAVRRSPSTARSTTRRADSARTIRASSSTRSRAWIDASNVYGSDAERADGAAVELDGTGRLANPARETCSRSTSAGLPNAGGPGSSRSLFLAGRRARQRAGRAHRHAHAVRARAQPSRRPERIARSQSPGWSVTRSTRRRVGW